MIFRSLARSSALALACAACGAEPSAPPKSSAPGASLPDAGAPAATIPPIPFASRPDGGRDAGSQTAGEELPPIPEGVASLDVHVPRGGRMPLTLSGRVAAIRPPAGRGELGAWTEVELQGASARPQRFYLLKQPNSLALPFAPGDRVSAEIDCRKGGWHRICDAVVRNDQRQIVLIVSDSGDERIAAGWQIEQGPVATSEIRSTQEKSIRHTHSLVISREGRSLTIAPHVWHRFERRGESWLIEGYAEIWEGVRPPDAVNHRAFSFVRERVRQAEG